MDRLKPLFAFRGLAGRGEYWAVAIGGWVAMVVVILLAAGLSALLGPIGWIFGLPLVLILWANLATAVRRLHQRGKSGWWLLLFWLAPALLSAVAELGSAGGDPEAAAGALLFSLPSLCLSIWAIVDLGVLPAKKGANKYAAAEAAQVAEAFT